MKDGLEGPVENWNCSEDQVVEMLVCSLSLAQHDLGVSSSVDW